MSRSAKPVRVLASITGPRIKLILEKMAGKTKDEIGEALNNMKMKLPQSQLMLHIILKANKKEIDLSQTVNCILWEMSDGKEAVELTMRRPDKEAAWTGRS